MNLLYGEIVSIVPDEKPARGKVRVKGVLREISLELLTNPSPGDEVLMCEGVALEKVEKENPHVPGHTR